MVTTIPEARGGGPPVVEDKEAGYNLVLDIANILTCFRAHHHGRRSVANKPRKAIVTVQE